MPVKIDLSELSVIDDHCHPFTEETKKIDVEQFVASTDLLGGSDPSFLLPNDILKKYRSASRDVKEKFEAEYHIESTISELRFHGESLLLYKRVVKELSRFLGCAENLEEIVRERNLRSADYRQYLTSLFTDAGLEALLVDDGYSELTVEHPLPSVEIDEFRRYVPIAVSRITRLEPLVQRALDNSDTFEDCLNSYLDSLEFSVRKLGSIAFKSLIAYRSGLDIQRSGEEEAKRDFEIYRNRKDRRIKKLRDYFFCRTLEKSIELDVPVQIHTGIGDVDIILESCSPINLFNILKDEELRYGKIVLVHSGYPYVSEAAYLSAVLPNIYLDLSVMNPLTNVNLPYRILQIIETAPVSKILYGSDSVQIPEMHWISAKIGKNALAKAFEEVVEDGSMDEDEAYKAADLILSENVKRLYRLSR